MRNNEQNIKPKQLLLILILLFSNYLIYNDCFAQKGLSHENIIPGIDYSSLAENEEELMLSRVRGEKIIHRLKLTRNEMDLLIQIKQLEGEAEQCLKDAELVVKEIKELNNSIEKTQNNDDSYLKIKRRINRYTNYEISLRFDAEELFEISNSLLYNIYSDHFPTSIMLISKNNNYQQQINELNAKAGELFFKSLKNQEKAYNNTNYKKGLEFLIKANFFKKEAIKKLEQAYVLYYNIKSVIDSDIDLISLLNPEKSDVLLNTVSYSKDANTFNNGNETMNSEIDSSHNNILNNDYERLIYKVQIGAFTNAVDIKKFHGLSTLSVDSTDQNVFTKYMVGQYFSYNAACEAKKIIINSTYFKDAFIVAYKNDNRVPVEETINISENMDFINK